MTSHDDAIHLQDNVFIATASGSAMMVFGMSLHFMSHDLEEDKFTSSQRVASLTGKLLYVAGLLLITIAVSIWREDGREMIGGTTSRILTQVREKQAQPSINEAAIIAGVSAGLIAASTFILTRDYDGARRFRRTAGFGYGLGWVGLAFAAAMINKGADSIDGGKLALTLPGAVMIAGGTYLVPWQYHHGYTSGPALPFVSLGFALFTIGNSYNQYHTD